MKKTISFFIVAMSLLSLPAFAQADKDTSNLLGMAGDNLDLYGVLTLFQKSKTIEQFEKSLNDPKSKLNNLDLDLNKKIDFIKVTTKKSSAESYAFVLQVDVSKTETQDVAVILLDKNKDTKKVSLQIVGDETLYGKDYVIEPQGNSPVTPNPAYTGTDAVILDVPPTTTTTTVVVESAPIVQYVYSPAYVPYVPPYYYGFPPPWFAMGACIAVGIYRANCYHYHGGYYGGHYGGGHNTVVINNNNNFNNYNNNKQRSNSVSDNMQRGNYGDNRANRDRASTSDKDRGRDNNNRGRDNNDRGRDNNRPTTNDRSRDGDRGSNDRGRDNNRPTTSDRSRDGNRGSSSPSVSTNDRSRGSSGPSASTRQSGGGFSQSRQSSGASRNMSSGSMNRGGGGMSRGGGGGRRR